MGMLISVLLALEQFDEAVEAAEAALRIQPNLAYLRCVDFETRQHQLQGLPPILINTQDNSGAGFIADTLCNGLDLPYCRITLPGVTDRVIAGHLAALANGGALCRQDLAPRQDIVRAILDSGIDRFITHVRDPRQTMITAIRRQVVQQLPRGDNGGSLTERIDRYIADSFAGEAEWTGKWLAMTADPPVGLRIRLSTYETMSTNRRRFVEDSLAFLGIPLSVFDWSVLNEKAGSATADEWKSLLTPQQQRDCAQIMREAHVDHYL